MTHQSSGTAWLGSQVQKFGEHLLWMTRQSGQCLWIDGEYTKKQPDCQVIFCKPDDWPVSINANHSHLLTVGQGRWLSPAFKTRQPLPVPFSKLTGEWWHRIGDRGKPLFATGQSQSFLAFNQKAWNNQDRDWWVTNLFAFNQNSWVRSWLVSHFSGSPGVLYSGSSLALTRSRYVKS